MPKQNFLLFTVTAIIFFQGFSQENSQAKMFRFNSQHNGFVSAPHDLVYDTKEWRFDAGAPVRSTPLAHNGLVYFGTAKGDFFALDGKTGNVKWKYVTGKAIHSSPALQGDKIYFTDNSQALYCLNAVSGKVNWKVMLGTKKEYPWRYDYYYSSPVLQGDKLLVGADDGFFYAFNRHSGKVIWKHACKGIVRSSAAVYKNSVLFGDTEATLYALDINSGKEKWQYKINGDTMRNEDFGFDRRAINASPVVAGEKLIFGARDGFLYCIGAENGKDIWKVDHRISWVISTVAVKDEMVVTGTSDGRFVQAVDLATGKEVWKFKTPLAVWSSPLIVNDKVYAGGFDGQLYCIDLSSGARISQFRTNGKIMSSPVWSDGLLYIGSDDGYLYALTGHAKKMKSAGETDRYVYYENGVNIYFRSNGDLAIRNYLRNSGFRVIGSDSLAYFMTKEPAAPSVIVFASCYFPSAVSKDGVNSLIRKYLDRGGRIVMTGINPLVYRVDENAKQAVAFRPHATDTILGLDYGKGDTRTFMGEFPCFPTTAGQQLGLPDFWNTSVFIDEKNIDLALGKNENGAVSAFVKNYANGGRFIQLWMDADKPDRMDAIIKAAEWSF